MFNLNRFENSLPDGFGVLEVVPGPEEQEPGQRAAVPFVPLRWTELTGEVTGPVAALRLVQRFGYTRGECDRVLEAVYRFPLPGDAAVTAVTVRFGEVVIRAALKEREAAEQEYDAAKSEGRQAALATREAPGVFTLQVAGIRPDEEVTVETSYVQLARQEAAGQRLAASPLPGASWTLRVPLTTPPRYVRQDEASGRHAQGQPLALLRDPAHRFALDLTLRGAAEVRSATHRLEVTPHGEDLRVRLQEGKVIPDRDCVLTWTARGEERSPALQVWTHDDAVAGHVHFLALVTAPAAPTADRVPREVVLLVDHSGSMHGPKWEAADWAVKRFLAGLSERDRFGLGLFHYDTRWFAPESRAGDAETVRQAVQFLERHRDSGGTELGVALEQALHLGRSREPEGAITRHVLVITDAQVTDAGRILRLAEEERRRPERRRISVLCIDAAPNDLLARELAARGGGVARFLTSAPDEEDITTALDAVLAEWEAPLVAGLRLEVSHPEVQTGGAERLPAEGGAEGSAPGGRVPARQRGWRPTHSAAGRSGWSALDLGDLAAGRARWVTGRVPRAEARTLSFRLVAPGQGKLAAADVSTAGSVAPAVPALFAARLVLALEFLVHSGRPAAEVREALSRLGYDPDVVLAGDLSATVYAENVRAEASAALRNLLVREALAGGIACSETAFVAAREEAGQRVEESVAVANALPSGWSEQFAAPAVLRGAGAGRIAYASMAMPAAAPLPQTRGLLERLRQSGASKRWAQSLHADAQEVACLAAPVTEEPLPPEAAPGAVLLFDGVPTFRDGEAVLWDSAVSPERWQGAVMFTQLALRFPGGAPDAEHLGPELALLLFVGDLAAPRARVAVADLLRQGGARPLNLRRRPGEVVRLMLHDPNGVWEQAAAGGLPPRIGVTLSVAS
jgi:Ca-activated chloride channel family protein